MKNMIKLPAIVLGLMLLLTGTTHKVMAQGEDVSLQSFYDELSPYGTWIQDPQYGYVWRPDVEQGDFRPYYTNGRWVMTEYGNTWVSDYDWGWGPFHYGRWVYNRYNEWIWIPDTTWGPAWVSWRSGGGYYGWAPLGPGMHVNINFNIPDLWWVFVPQRNIYYDRFPRYYSRRNVVIINNTTIINNTYVHNRRTYYTGPRADDIRRATRQDVRVYNVNNTGRPSRSSIDGNSVNIYTPRPGRGSSNASAAPREAIRAEGRTTMRDSRTNNGSTSARPSRIENRGADNGTGVAPSTRARRPDNDNSSRPSRIQNREITGATQPQRTERPAPGERQMQRPQQMQTAPEQRAERQERPQRQERAERPMQRAEAQRAQPQPRPEQPQRQESRPAQPQMQRPERVQQSPQPSSRGSEGRGGSDGSRPGRGGGRG
jgi:hypothetical protein